MIVLVVIIGVVIAAAALVAAGHLSRIADAIEEQNKAYGVGEIPHMVPTPGPEPRAPGGETPTP